MTAGHPGRAQGARVRPLFSLRPAEPRPSLLGEGTPRARPLFEPAVKVPPAPAPPEAPPDADLGTPGPGGAGASPPLAVAAVPAEDPSVQAERGEPAGRPAGEAAEPRDPLGELQEELRAEKAAALAERERYAAALRELERVHALDFSALEEDLVDVALEIAKAILMRELKTDRLYVVRLVEAALRVAVEDEQATLLVAPADLALVEQERSRLEVQRGGGLIRIAADPALHPGDCLLQVGRARIDARLSDRLERVRQALHGVVTETE